MPKKLKIHLLDVPLAIRNGETQTHFSNRKALALLAYLACSGAAHSRAELADLLWDDRSSARSSANLRTLLTRVRAEWGDWIDIGRETVGMVGENGWWLDVTELRTALAEAGRMQHQGGRLGRESVEHLQTAVELYRGEFMAGFSVRGARVFEEWLLLQRESLHRDARNTLTLLADHYLAIRTYSQGVEVADRLVGLDALDENAQRRLITLLALDGQQQAALDQYQSCVRLLADELGVGPTTETVVLIERIRSGVLLPLDVEGDNPYKGLHAYAAADAEDFYGREAFLDRLHENLERLPFTAVLGASGSGKTSVLQATMATHRQGAAPWVIAYLRPGPKPFAALAEQLVTLLAPDLRGDTAMLPLWTQELRQELESGEVGLAVTVEHILSQSQEQGEPVRRLLIIIDQFEELYSLCDDTNVRRRFIDLILSPAYEPVPPATDANSITDLTPSITLLLALRADFAAQALAYGPLSQEIQRGGLILGPMTPAEMRRAITEPACSRGVSFEPGLVDRLLADAGDEPGSLPLLQFTLSELWKQQAHMQIIHSAYNDSGGVAGALRAHAEQVYIEFAPAVQERVRRIFSRLVHPVPDAGTTRRLVTRAEFDNNDWRIVQKLADARLVVTGQDLRGQETAELVHEALIEHWPRLRDWTEADREFNIWLRRLRSAFGQWQDKGEPGRALLTDIALDEAIFWLHARAEDLTETEIAFIEAGQARRDRAQIERESVRRQALAQAEALATSERGRAEVAARARRRLSWLTIALALTALLLLAAGLFAFNQRNVARRAADTAQSLNLATSAQLALNQNNTDLALALALEANAVTNPPLQAQHMLAAAAYHPGAVRVFDDPATPFRAATLSTDGQVLLAAGQNGELFYWQDAAAGERRTLATAPAVLNTLAMSPDARTAFGGDANGDIFSWAIPAGQRLQSYQVHNEAVLALAVSPDGNRLLSASADDSLTLWDVETGAVIHRLMGHNGDVISVAFSPDGNKALSGSTDQSVIYWDLASGEAIHTFAGGGDTISASAEAQAGHAGAVWGVGFAKDGMAGFSAAADRQAFILDLTTGTISRKLPVLEEGVFSMTVVPEADKLIMGLLDGSLVIHDLVQQGPALFVGGRRWQMRGHGARIQGLGVSSDGRRALSMAGDGSMRLWDLQNGAELMRLSENYYGSSVDVSPDGHTCLVSMFDGQLQLFDCASGQIQHNLSGHDDMIFADAHFSADGKRVVSGSGDVFGPACDASLRVWDVSTGEQLHRFDDHTDRIWDVAVDASGRYAASASHDGTIRLCDLDSGTGEIVADFQPQAARSLAFSPDGQTLLVGLAKGSSNAPDYALHLIDLEGKELRRFEGHTSVVADIAFSSDGRMALSGSVDKSLILWDVASGQIVHRMLGHQSGLSAVAFSPDGFWIASAGNDALILLWDVESGQVVRQLAGHGDVVLGVAFLPDGQRLLSTSADDTVRLWRLDRTSVALQDWIATNRHVSELTDEQRVLYNIVPSGE